MKNYAGIEVYFYQSQFRQYMEMGGLLYALDALLPWKGPHVPTGYEAEWAL
jgi:hypothetical protein